MQVSYRLGALFGLMAATPLSVGCERGDPPAPQRPAPAPNQAGKPVLPDELKPPAPAAKAPEAPPAPTSWSIQPSFPADYKGTWFAVTSLAAGVYMEPSFEGKKIGYLRNGSRVPVASEPVSKTNCTGGWYALGSGGFVCGNLGTTDLGHPEVKFATRAPNLAEVLPYPYARNAKHGTPLYRSVPSREQMERYEPYLLEKKEAEGAEIQRASDTTAVKPAPADGAALGAAAGAAAATAAAQAGDLAAAMADGGLITATAPADPDPEKPWWQRENIKERLHEVKLEELESDADDVLAKRMVTGFYVAVDKTFRWNNRAWYKTTKGLVTPTDRFWQTAGPKFKGVEIDGTTFKLPVAWVYGGRKNAGTYSIDPTTNKVENAPSIDKFVAVQLTGKSVEIGNTRYEQLADGKWMKRSHLRVTQPNPPPKDVAPNERWVDVNLKTQTLVAFVGDKPVYATMISSGKESKNPDKDHRTPLGEWRVREKHITTTMDGDGSAAGDLPYSIEDVPYVLYYHRAYALHGAFWHNNFGVQMSHGCVNLAPLDAKHLFFFADPPIPPGFHGVWSTEKNPGTRVVVHE